jgi:hypothetical protein
MSNIMSSCLNRIKYKEILADRVGQGQKQDDIEDFSEQKKYFTKLNIV